MNVRQRWNEPYFTAGNSLGLVMKNYMHDIMIAARLCLNTINIWRKLNNEKKRDGTESNWKTYNTTIYKFLIELFHDAAVRTPVSGLENLHRESAQHVIIYLYNFRVDKTCTLIMIARIRRKMDANSKEKRTSTNRAT